MEHQRANVSHWMRGQKVHNFILNSLQFSESFQKHTVVWIFLQLVLTRHKIERKRKERNMKTAITLGLNALCVLCSTIISAHFCCIYVLRLWLRNTLIIGWTFACTPVLMIGWRAACQALMIGRVQMIGWTVACTALMIGWTLSQTAVTIGWSLTCTALMIGWTLYKSAGQSLIRFWNFCKIKKIVRVGCLCRLS